MIPIAVATEDELSEALALRLVSEVRTPHQVTLKLRKGGFGYLQSKMDSWCQLAQQQVVLVLTDLDRAACPVEFRDKWLGNRGVPANLLLRVAVRESESWVLADHIAMRELIGAKGVLPPYPDTLPEPKQTLLGLAKGAPRSVREELIKAIDGNLSQGLGYNARLTHWVNTQWSPKRAAERSPSLARARVRIREVAAAFKS